MLGIIGAMPIETEHIKNAMTNVRIVEKSMIKYYFGKLRCIPCVVACSGVGKVNSAVCAQTMLLEFGVDKIINVGVAGGLLENMSPGDIVLSREAVQHDMDITALREPAGLIPTINVINLPCSSSLREKVVNALNGKGLKFYQGKIASGDKFISESEDLSDIKNKFDAIACDMETASIAHVCYLNNVDFLAIRVISDNINKDHSEMDYEKFKKSMAESIAKILANIVEHI